MEKIECDEGNQVRQQYISNLLYFAPSIITNVTLLYLLLILDERNVTKLIK